MTHRPKPEQQRALHEALQVFDLEQTYEQLQAEAAYAAGRNAITLRKAPDMQLVLLAQRAGNMLDEHRAPGPITLQVLRGHVRFAAAEQTVDLRAGMLVALDGGITHSVEALEDSACLLTLGRQSR
jgi:quercetin dioxygenase-like cupin family protein